jgi:hypothetical protein
MSTWLTTRSFNRVFIREFRIGDRLWCAPISSLWTTRGGD